MFFFVFLNMRISQFISYLKESKITLFVHCWNDYNLLNSLERGQTIGQISWSFDKPINSIKKNKTATFTSLDTTQEGQLLTDNTENE